MELSLEAIRGRSSVRSFDGQPLAPEEGRALEAAFSECVPGPFGGRSRFVLVTAPTSGLAAEASSGTSVSGKIGTYGLISKVPTFLVGAIKKGLGAFEDFGHAMEGLVLRATEVGLGSCWIGGIFDRGAAAKALRLADDEYLPAIVALGHGAERSTIPDRITRSMARARTRKAREVLFFDGSFEHPLVDFGPWSEVFEALRLAPSASNKQPWRILYERRMSSGGQAFHFILEEDRIYNSALGEIRIQNVDMGIAMRHFEAAARTLGLSGTWKRLEREPDLKTGTLRYITSWIVPDREP